MISQNLLTDVATPNGGALVLRDQAALQVVSQWLADPRFEKLKPTLLKRTRLEDFAQQAGPPR